eukprot:9482934-Pyramimonas_sp.AAC.1
MYACVITCRKSPAADLGRLRVVTLRVVERARLSSDSPCPRLKLQHRIWIHGADGLQLTWARRCVELPLLPPAALAALVPGTQMLPANIASLLP